MIVRQAKDIARQWVIEEAGNIPGFTGAFLHGSINWLADDAALSAASDVDVIVVLDSAAAPDKLGKFLYRDVLLDVSYLPSDQLQSPDQVLTTYELAGSFRGASIIADPSGRLTALQTAVAKDYGKRRWVYARCARARDKVLGYMRSLKESDPFHDQVTAWLFATGVTTHVLLVAGLKNPTVRRRHVAAQELLAQYGRSDFYETLLQMLGCAEMTRARLEQHLAAGHQRRRAPDRHRRQPRTHRAWPPPRGRLLDRRHAVALPEGPPPRCAAGPTGALRPRLSTAPRRPRHHLVRRPPAALRTAHRAPPSRLVRGGGHHGGQSGDRGVGNK